MVFAADYPFLNIFWTMIMFFCWVAWIWVLVLILSDVFRRHISGWAKAAWVIFMIVLPFIGVLVYLIAHSSDMTERRVKDAQASQAQFDEYVQDDGGGVHRRPGGRDREGQGAARQRRDLTAGVRRAQGEGPRLGERSAVHPHEEVVMSTPSGYTPTGARGSGGFSEADYDDAHGQGLVTFAGVMIAIAATLNIIYGIAAIDSAHVFVNNAKYVSATSTPGVVPPRARRGPVLRRVRDLAGHVLGPLVRCRVCDGDAILQTFWIPAFPILAMTILTLDIVAIWGLLAYGGRRRAYHDAQ